MSAAAIVFRSTHRIRYSDLDPYNHVSTANYATYFVDHRMHGLRGQTRLGYRDGVAVAIHGLGSQNP
jgi:acyl-CoA thioesterase FadM